MAGFGQIEKAKDDYDKLIKLSPENIDVYYTVGFFYQEIGEFDIALNLYNQASEINPLDTRIIISKALLYSLKLNDFNKSIS